MAATFERERAVAEAAVLRAAILTKRVQSSRVHAVSKADATPVTVADFAAQALLISALHAAFPDDRFLGEEDSSALRRDPALRDAVYALVSSSADGPASVDDMLDLIDLGGAGAGGPAGRFWAMDPIDGTATFLKGQQYAVALALVEHGREVVGVVAYPSLDPDAGGGVGIRDRVVDAPDGMGVLLTAVKGRGATVRRFPSLAAASLASSPASPLPPLPPPPPAADLRFVDCQRSSSTDHGPVRALAARLGAKYPGLDIWASHVRYAALVLGAADAWVRVPRRGDAVFCTWDNAGAQLLFTERGGCVTDLDGREIDFGAGRALSANRGMVAARADVHAELLAAVTDVLAAEDDKEAAR
ncbi:Inositol monophosphatase [Cordyceps fumosorosea ARSEF 2679]|uniref:Inositol monophosphatase n=1 Tax=Cordyceps fumosorosea (strain ARSEF 2679) TaxID=1081104 RepID=A0A168B371_CORFA|nr:Inositol monophosphatase [Cordyceps fumosorosea ARSEF 2679]OAA69557.1 Inositol monophosphatase [Cordyceps fumosorosea ARSEF 2679]